MLDDEFRKPRARTVRDLAEKANDPFIKGWLLDLVARYEDGGPKTHTPLTPVDLQFESRRTGQSGKVRGRQGLARISHGAD